MNLLVLILIQSAQRAKSLCLPVLVSSFNNDTKRTEEGKIPTHVRRAVYGIWVGTFFVIGVALTLRGGVLLKHDIFLLLRDVFVRTHSSLTRCCCHALSITGIYLWVWDYLVQKTKPSPPCQLTRTSIATSRHTGPDKKCNSYPASRHYDSIFLIPFC